MTWPDWDTVASWLELMLRGLVVTLQLSAVTTVFTIVLAVLGPSGRCRPACGCAS